jgi:hypothetical protein
VDGTREEEARRSDSEALAVARTVRDACLRAALDGYEQAGLGGLCDEGRWEAAIDAIRSLNLASILARPPSDPP